MAADPNSGAPQGRRKVKLSEVPFQPKTVKGCDLRVRYQSYRAVTKYLSAKLIKETAQSLGVPPAPGFLILWESHRVPGDYHLEPTMVESNDHMEVDWTEKGTVARIDMTKLLSHHAVEIPKETNLVIDVYPDTDIDGRPVIGLAWSKVRFVPITAKKKEPEKNAPAGDGGDD